MNWMALLQILGEIAILALLIIFLFGKKFIGKLGEKVAEVSVSKIKTEIEEKVKQGFRVELEAFKADLSKSNKIHEIDYSKFQQKRFDVVVELYGKFTIMLGAALEFTKLFIPGDNPTEVMKQRSKYFAETERELNNYLMLNKLFIEEKLFEEMFTKKQSIQSLCNQYYDIFKKLQMPSFSETEKLELVEQQVKISNMIPTQLSTIENELRKLLYPTK